MNSPDLTVETIGSTQINHSRNGASGNVRMALADFVAI